MKYMQMGNAQKCPEGTEIETLDECKDAMRWSEDLGIHSWTKAGQITTASWTGIAPQCSYQSNGEQHFHFNTLETENAVQFLDGNYQMICKKGKVVCYLL